MMKTYACINKNEEIRKESSSGGVFYELAKYIIEKKGVVFGARFNDEWEVVHDYCEKIQDINKFMGSKYSQSKIGNSFQLIKEFLNEGRLVLFIGTPCQVEGLNSFLGKEYENLVLVDFICHGVPSPLIWNSYLECMNKEKITKINFRNKEFGWTNFSLRIDYTNQDKYVSLFKNDIYMKGFLKDIYLRPSCYSCSFRGMNKISDFTLGDFWGVKKIKPDMFDDKGISILILNSKKSEMIFESIKQFFIFEDVNTNDVIKHNKPLISSPKIPKQRKKFYSNMSYDLIKNIKMNTKDSAFVVVKKTS
ncbi:MAG: Coenzyme F420 hydrogenase/dehydrogenase, beta subunit C-terminal domain, partial [Traorella sp.]